MASILCVGTSGSNDPTKASLPFVVATSAVEKGHEPQITLLGEAVNMMRPAVADSVHGVGFVSFRELLDKALGQEIPIHL